MTTLKETAQAYEPQQTKNIADLEKVQVDLDIKSASAKDKDGKEFSYNYIEVDEEQYRVPDSVLKQLKVQLKSNPDLQYFKVEKEGTGMNTDYTVVPLRGDVFGQL